MSIIRRNFLFGFCLLAFALGNEHRAFAQPDGVAKSFVYFEGKIDYTFSAEGQKADKILEINNIRYMQTIIKDGDFIVHLWGKQAEPDRMRSGNVYEDGAAPRIEMPHQVFPTTRLYIADSNRVYVVDAANERVFRKEPKNRKLPKKVPVAVAGKDSMKICGVMCYAYHTKYDKEEITYYVSPQIRVNLGYYKGKYNSKAAWLTKGLNGSIPLRTIRKTPDYTIDIKATKISREKYTKEMFRIPKQFKINGYDYRRG
jgi:urease accessory protein UreE